METRQQLCQRSDAQKSLLIHPVRPSFFEVDIMSGLAAFHPCLQVIALLQDGVNGEAQGQT